VPQAEATRLDRGVGGRRIVDADHFRRRLISHPLAEHKDQRGSDDERDARAHGSPDPHELHAPIVRVVGVLGQRFGHSLANQHEAGRFNAQLDQVFAH
jgi:hypothetical protein